MGTHGDPGAKDTFTAHRASNGSNSNSIHATSLGNGTQTFQARRVNNEGALEQVSSPTSPTLPVSPLSPTSASSSSVLMSQRALNNGAIDTMDSEDAGQ